MSGDRQEHWREVYTTRAVDSVSWFQAEPAPSLALIASAGVGAGAAVIDIGGGASSLVDRLHWAGFRSLSVLDISEAATAVARGRMAAAAEAVEWITADVTTWSPPPNAYHLWHDRAVFHFLTAEPDRRAYLAALNKGLMPGGWLVLASFALSGPERCSGLPVQRYSAQGLSVALGPGFELVTSAPETHVTPAGAPQDFTWTLFRKISSKA